MTLFDMENPDQLRPIDLEKYHFEASLLNTKPTVGPEDLERLDEWTQQYGVAG